MNRVGICMHIHTFIHSFTRSHIHTFTHAHIQYVHMYIHTHKYILSVAYNQYLYLFSCLCLFHDLFTSPSWPQVSFFFPLPKTKKTRRLSLLAQLFRRLRLGIVGPEVGRELRSTLSTVTDLDTCEKAGGWPG